MSFFAAVVEMPRTPPSSATQNSATSGAPSPAMGSSCSHPGTVNEAASWIDSGGCRSAHAAARISWSAAAWSSAALRSRIADSTAAGERSSATPRAGASSPSIMCTILVVGSDNGHAREPAVDGAWPANPGVVSRLASLAPQPPRATSRYAHSCLAGCSASDGERGQLAVCSYLVRAKWELVVSRLAALAPRNHRGGAGVRYALRHPPRKSWDPRVGWVFSHVLAPVVLVLFSRSQTPTVAKSREIRGTGKKQL
jgi:hypothetical protein